jgi:hypothetical protein
MTRAEHIESLAAQIDEALVRLSQLRNLHDTSPREALKHADELVSIAGFIGHDARGLRQCCRTRKAKGKA